MTALRPPVGPAAAEVATAGRAVASAELVSAPTARPPTGLYVHVPFCVSHCPYCDFVVVAGREARGPVNKVGAFTRALEVELELRADELDRRWGPAGPRPALASLYLGGGTPSLLSTAAIERLVGQARQRFGLGDGAEVTLEVNPGPGERGDIAGARKAGVTRLSIGAQSLDPAELRTLGRRHSPRDVARTVRLARAAGIKSVSLDLLYDVPGQTLRSWGRTVDRALALAPDHLSLYALTLDDPDAEGITGRDGDHLPVRPGARRWRDRARARQDDDRAAEMYALADDRLAAGGLHWYEISNWARPGHASRHNLGYWRGGTWEALGPGAHAFDGATRRWNAARLDGYLAALLPGNRRRPRLPPGGRQPAARADTTILALRTSDGLPTNAVDAGPLRPALTWALEAELLARTAGDRLTLTRRGRLLAGELFARLV